MSIHLTTRTPTSLISTALTLNHNAGVYLATNASKSDIYTTPNDNGERFMFVMRTCLGEIHRTKAGMEDATRPPERADERGPLNSVQAVPQSAGGCVEYPEFIVYKDAQVLPEYLIRYSHGQGCKCSHCDT